MIVKVRMPAINANEEQGSLVRWLVSDGSTVERGRPICEVETTKATVEVESNAAGFLQWMIAVGEKVAVGGLLAVIKGSPDEAYVAETAETEQQQERKWTKKAFIVARRLGVNIEALADRKKDLVSEQDVLSFYEDGLAEAHDGGALRALVPPSATFTRVLLIGGAGGAGALALDALGRSADQFAVGIVDNNRKSHGTYIGGVPVLGGSEILAELTKQNVFDGAVVLFSEDVEERERQFKLYVGMGVPFTNLIDPSVELRDGVKMGKGNVVLPNCFFAVGAEIGDNNFFASHTVIEHHSKIGDHCTFGPRTTLSGRVSVGSGVKFGMSVSVEPYLTIGDRSVIASGRVITSSVASHARVRDKMVQKATD